MSASRATTVRPLSRRLRVCGGVGVAAGAVYSLVAAFADAFPTRRMLERGWEPTAAHTLAPVAGGLAMGLLVALLWPAGARKATALAAGVVAGVPFGLGIAVSMAGAAALTPGGVIGGALTSLVFGLPLGAFMYDYDR